MLVAGPRSSAQATNARLSSLIRAVMRAGAPAVAAGRRGDGQVAQVARRQRILRDAAGDRPQRRERPAGAALHELTAGEHGAWRRAGDRQLTVWRGRQRHTVSW